MLPHDEQQFRRGPAPAAKPDKGDAAASVGSLPAYPGNPDQRSELSPPKTALVDVLAGAVLGTLAAGIGCILAGCDTTTVVLGWVLGCTVGALDGLLVAKLFGKAATASVGAVLWAVPRVALFTLVWPILPLVILVGVRSPGRRRFGAWLDKWDQGGD